jgi:hypothetical protein
MSQPSPDQIPRFRTVLTSVGFMWVPFSHVSGCNQAVEDALGGVAWNKGETNFPAKRGNATPLAALEDCSCSAFSHLQ